MSATVPAAYLTRTGSQAGCGRSRAPTRDATPDPDAALAARAISTSNRRSLAVKGNLGALRGGVRSSVSRPRLDAISCQRSRSLLPIVVVRAYYSDIGTAVDSLAGMIGSAIITGRGPPLALSDYELGWQCIASSRQRAADWREFFW